MDSPLESKQRSTPSSDRPQAVQAARSLIGEQQQAAASGLGEFAGALRRAARDGNGAGSPVARIAESAADNLQRFSDSLRDRDLDGLLRDAESFAKRQPVVFIGAAALVGFLAVRFLKASDSVEPRRPSL
jgi:hypothetical protein